MFVSGGGGNPTTTAPGLAVGRLLPKMMVCRVGPSLVGANLGAGRRIPTVL